MGKVRSWTRRSPPAPAMSTASPSKRIVASSPTLARRRISRRIALPARYAALPETKVWREAEVLPQSGVVSVSAEARSNRSSGAPSASAHICGMTVFEPWPISTAPWNKVRRPSGVRPSRMVDGLGSEVLPQPYHMPATPQGFEAGLEADAVLEDLAGYGRVARLQGVENAKFEPVDAELQRELVIELLLRDRSLRHAEAAKRAGRHAMRMDGAGQRAVMRHAVRTGSMHRHAIGDGRAPGGVGAGVEVGGKIHGKQPAVPHRAVSGANARRMALGGGHDRFIARIEIGRA